MKYANDPKSHLGSSDEYKVLLKSNIKQVTVATTMCRSLLHKIERSVNKGLLHDAEETVTEISEQMKAIQKVLQLLGCAARSHAALLEALHDAEKQGVVLSATMATVGWECEVSQHIMFLNFPMALKMLVVGSEAVNRAVQAGISDTDLESRAVAIVEDFVMRTVQSVKISQVSNPSKVAEFKLMMDFVVAFEATEASHGQAFLARSLAEDLAGLRTLLVARSCKPTTLRDALQRLDETLTGTSVALTPLQVFLRDHAVCKQLLAHGQDRCSTRQVCLSV